jgi:hypothetical protein
MFRCFNSAWGPIVLGLAVLAAGYLVIWHSAHVAAALPFLVILACPLMHFFMHGRHHHGDGQDPTSQSKDQATTKGGGHD